MKADTMLDDNRLIEAVCYLDASYGESFKVGRSSCTKIEVYREAGQCGYVPWVAIFIGDELQRRVPATALEIVYATASRT